MPAANAGEPPAIPVPEGGPTEATLRRYADLAVRVGINVQPEQTLVVISPVETAAFARAIAAQAYEAGAHDVRIEWDDERAAEIRYRMAPEAALAEYPQWHAAALDEMAGAGAAFLSIAASDPDLLRGVDPERVAIANRARMTAFAGFQAKVAGMRTTWNVLSVATPGWAAKVFPGRPAAAATRDLWDLILKAVRLDAPDPVQAWRGHLRDLGARAAHMNAARFRSLHYTGPGTDLTVDLPEGHLWVCAPATDAHGIEFVPNMPTEEIFTMPARDGVRGTVRASMPLSYHGSLIEGMRLRFEEGCVVAAEADRGGDTLQRLLQTDAGARRLGEAALVAQGSAVSRLGTLFFNTLFDENAACHLALGRAYARCLEGGTALGEDELVRRGANISLEHADFMIGSPDLDIDGIGADGAATPVMRRGGWAFTV